MFLRRSDVENIVDFDWKFLDTGLVYRFKNERNYVMFKPLCPAALDALLEVYKILPLPSDISVASIQDGQLRGDEFEEVLFRQLLKHSAKGIAFETTDLNGNRVTDVHIQFKHFYFLEKDELAPQPQHGQSLVRGFAGYPRFDFMLGRMFIQLSLSPFDKHNTDSARIDLAFVPYRANDPRNQIEIYLDTTFGPGHKAEFSQGRFIVTQNGHPVLDFRIIYIQGKPGVPRHRPLQLPRQLQPEYKVDEYRKAKRAHESKDEYKHDYYKRQESFDYSYEPKKDFKSEYDREYKNGDFAKKDFKKDEYKADEYKADEYKEAERAHDHKDEFKEVEEYKHEYKHEYKPGCKHEYRDDYKNEFYWAACSATQTLL
ncbi:hypothetical protein AX16_005040 [Volvariella volvacea WC 439]|nr:hypothetical protein AX16_005040 [Volvariella volvacea WC 439]